ncbi:uncharacterized protein LOC127280186 [Leptopilina boulardi]|uniref:uncharacterized protein LOC127280186 n=1 Tax=Leptopilina boulardi TaxID=63433 RepID=UPI0021F6995A|nr:uncharacterized protein LOC127280186 [Leptopilina boulardi]
MSEGKNSDKNEEQKINCQIKFDEIKNQEKLNNSEFLDEIQQDEKNDNNESNKIEQLKIDKLNHDEHEKHEFFDTIQELKNDNQFDSEKENEKNDNMKLSNRIEELKINYDDHDKKNSSNKFRPIKNLKFCGMRDPVHPALFIENFEFYATEENLNEDEKQNHFVNSLRKYAAIWLNDRGYGTYDEMKEAFLSFYWSSDIQDLFVKNLETGKYTKKCQLSMANYFFKHAIGAKYLDISPSEKEIIDKLMKHFDKHIEDEILIQKAKTMEEVIDILKRIDILKGTNKITNLSQKVTKSIISTNKKNSYNTWGWLFLLLAITSVGLNYFSKIFMTK